MLIQAKRRVNGMTVLRHTAQSVTYWHTELAHHDVLLAEGIAAESFLDVGNRGSFDSGSAFLPTPVLDAAGAAPGVSGSCAQLVTEGSQLTACRQRLLDRAVAALATSGPRRASWRCSSGAACSRPTASVAIAGGSACRCAVRRGLVSGRWLGVCVRALVGDGTPIALDDEGRFGSGWHARRDAPGEGWRWTHGDALLPSGSLIELTLGGAPRYRMERRAEAAWCGPAGPAWRAVVRACGSDLRRR